LVGIARGSAQDVVLTMTAMRVTTVSLLGVVVLLTSWYRRRSGERAPGTAAARPEFAAVRASAGAYLLVGLFDVGANLSFGAASRLGMLTLVSVFGSLYPVATILLAWRIDGERLRAVQYVGVAAALAGAAAISVG
jgi:drug/metabolite transporter (DMT)-like permease